jgi:hypothetical protein
LRLVTTLAYIHRILIGKQNRTIPIFPDLCSVFICGYSIKQVSFLSPVIVIIMLQNRVDPFGNIIKTEARGAWMGNRGILHNDNRELLRPFKLKAWLACKLEFNGRKRQVMAPNRYTELFFLDEATSFAAGHRPCFECRRPDYNIFKSFWLKGNPEYGFDEKTSIQKIDNILHKERMGRDRSKVIYDDNINQLPNGAFVLFNDEAYLISNGSMYLWSPFGYEKGIAFPTTDKLPVLTPRSVINAFRAGYVPQMAVTQSH